ncbi:MAG: hypothetical protein IPO23_09640 [Flavobacterium sp.]|nr:hypothetical protein [Flavobacterium sp.]
MIGVTSVLVVVAATPFKVSAPLPLLLKTLPTVVATVVLGVCVGRCIHYSIDWVQDYYGGGGSIKITQATVVPDSHNWYVML